MARGEMVGNAHRSVARHPHRSRDVHHLAVPSLGMNYPLTGVRVDGPPPRRAAILLYTDERPQRPDATASVQRTTSRRLGARDPAGDGDRRRLGRAMAAYPRARPGRGAADRGADGAVGGRRLRCGRTPPVTAGRRPQGPAVRGRSLVVVVETYPTDAVFSYIYR